MPQTHEDFEYMENRVYHDYVASAHYDVHQPSFEPDSHTKVYQPYEQDLSQYPEVFKKYQENYEQFDKVKQRFEDEDPLAEAGPSPLKRKA